MTDKTDSKEREDFKRWAEGQPWIKDCAPAAHGRKETFGHWDTEKAWLAYQAGRAFLAANAGTNCERCGGSGEDPEGFYDQSRGDAGHTHDGPCRACDGSGVAASAGSEPVESNRPSLESVFRGLSDRAYCNYIEQMRRNECLGWEHKVKHGTFGEAELKAHTLAGRLLGRHHAFAEAANALRGSDAPLTHPSPPEGMVGGWMPIETAPADGQCLVWCETDDGGEVMRLYRDKKGNWLYEGEPTYATSFYIEPTHWMPLPPPPTSSADSRKGD